MEARRRLPATGTVWSSDGVVVTANHVGEREDKIRFGLPDGTEASATVIGPDPTTDVAALRVEASGLAAELGQETGLLLASVEAGGPAERAGLFLGDTLVEMDGRRLRQLDDLLGMLGGDRVGASLGVKLVRGGSVQDLTVVVGDHR